MRAFPILLALFIGLPLVEIYLFIKLGGLIGAFTTVLLIIATALIGVSLLRAQGFSTMAKFQHQVANGQLPADTMLEGVALLIGGALLLTPGFLTDSLGLMCLIPFTRRTLIAWLLKNMTRSTASLYTTRSRQKRHDPDVIEGEFKNHDEPWK